MKEERDSFGRFTKGHTESTEIRLKRVKALKEAWLTRTDYIGDLIKENPYIYSVWRSIRFTEKGKKIGYAEEWKDFKTFYKDVLSDYLKGKVFRRKNFLLPYGKDNFVWISKEDLPLLESANSIYLTYQNKTQTIRLWCEELSLNYNGVRQRAYKHKNDYTIEEILFGKKIIRGSKKVRDWKDDLKKNICTKASKMISSYKARDKKLGLTVCDIDIDWMVDNIITKPCVYCGDIKRVGCDRIDNSKGHTKNNVVPCCYECNCARNSNFTYREMLVLGKTISQIKSNREKESE